MAGSMPNRKVAALAGLLVLLFMVLPCRAQEPEQLKVVGVLGNTSALSERPVPYAFYTGIAADERGRLYLAGSAEGIPVCSQDGICLAVLALPQAEGATIRSLMVRAGDYVFAIGINPQTRRSMLFRIVVRGEDATKLPVERLAAGPGHWALSPTLDAAGKVIFGQSEVDKLRYTVAACDPASGQLATLLGLNLPKGTAWPWRNTIQAEPDGTFSIVHCGVVDFSGRYNAKGERAGDALSGCIVDGFHYIFGYEGGLRRTDLHGAAAPGDCGSPAPEIRMAAQMVGCGDRYFFAGRGGVLEAEWSGTHFVYTRRIGAVLIEDMSSAGAALEGIAWTAQGNDDVQHPLTIPKAQPSGQLLEARGPLHGKSALTLVPGPECTVYVGRESKGVSVFCRGPQHLAYDLALPEVREAGQAAVLDKDMLLADPKSGTIWKRPLLDKHAAVAAWRTGLPGVTGLAVSPDAVFAATATQVSRFSRDGLKAEWSAEPVYKGVRRLAAASEYLYVCDTLGNIVDQLEAKTGRLLARLGSRTEAGASLTRLSRPWAIAADANGVYIADNGNGRVLVATTTLWRPDISVLPREDKQPLAAARIPLTPPQPGRMSVNVYDTSNLTVRQLICAGPSEQPVIWDGRDLYGRWAKPGKYRYHGILAPRLSLRYVSSVGQSGNPPYRTADGKGSWGGVWGDVMDVCPVSAEPASDIVVLWAVEEGEGGLIRMSQDGEVRWKAHLDWWMKASQMAVASDGEFIYVACASAMAAPEGQAQYNGTLNRPMIWRVEAATGNKRLYGAAPGPQPMFGEYCQGERVVTDIAVRDGKLYLTAPAQNKLFVADAKTGRQLAAWPLEKASGVAFDARGSLLAGSGSKIVALDDNGGVARTLGDAGGEIWDLDATKDGLVATVGAPRHQVVFINAEGKETLALGRLGGRPLSGKMEPQSFRSPAGLCVTGNGKLFVAEHAAPRRFTRWSLDGKLEREFHGPYYYSGMFGVDDEQPEHVYGDTHTDIIRYLVNYDTGKWEVDRYWINAYGQSGVPAKWWPRIRHKEGKTWWCSGSGAIVELNADGARGVAAVYGGWVSKLPDGDHEPAYHTKKTGLKGTWSDLNGDGRKQPDEWQVTDKPAYPITGSGPQQGWGCYFDEDFNLYMHDWSDDEAGGVWKIPVAEWKNGAPVYRWEQARHVGLPRQNGLAHGAGGARTAFAANGAVYAFNGGYNAAGLPGVGHGHDWEFAQLTKYEERTGQPLWHAGQRTSGFAAAGEHYCPTGAAGSIGEYLFWTDENSLVHVWDVEHGLYVDTLLEDVSRGPEPSAYTVWVELFNTRVFRHPKSGKVYLMAASDAIHIFEVLGTEQKLVRFEGEFELTAEGLAAAQKRVAARTVETIRTLEIKRAAGPVAIDGDLSEFAQAPAATLLFKANAQGSARLLYDDKFLYVGFDVKDDSPWKNSGGDISTLFKTGDCADVWLGPSPGKRQLGAKDVRILFAPNGAKTVAVAFRPKAAQGAQRVPFRSPSGEVWMDKVEELKDVQVAVKTTDAGYRLEAAIPRSAIGLEKDVERIGLDLSLNFSDPAGQRNVARFHWGRNGAAMVYDLPSEARFEPETWGVGLFR